MSTDDDQPTRPDRPQGNLDRGTVDLSPRATTDPSTVAAPPSRFEEREELGRGGMGRVFEAFDRTLGRSVAVKQVLDVSDIARARFEREARITARLQHPGIVPVHDLGRGADGVPFYVMKRIDGEPLDGLVANKTFAQRMAQIPNVLAACDACAYAHAHGVIHRDIKPTNIVVGAFGETLLIDWGLARDTTPAGPDTPVPVSDPSLTVAGSVAGTPAFMAPEQARGEAVDARADVYALGATLFYVIAGALPSPGTTGTAMIEHAAAGGAPQWSRLPEKTPPELRAILEKAMASRATDRYPDAAALAADLRSYVTGQLVGAYEYGLWDQIRRFARRHRASLAVAALALVVIAVGLVISARRIIAERDVARTQTRAALDAGDALRVQRALQLARTDPVAAVAVLRQLRTDSAQWPRAAVAATAASVYGVPIGFALPITGPGSLESSSEGTWVAALPFNTDALELFEVATRRRIHIPLGRTPTNLRWIDDKTLVFGGDGAVMMLDPATQKLRSIPFAERVSQIESDGAGTGWLRTLTGDVIALSPSLAALAPPIATATKDIAVAGPGTLAVLYDTRVDVIDARGVRTLYTGPVEGLIAGGERVAARVGSDLCTWKLDVDRADQACAPLPKERLPIALLRDSMWTLLTTGGVIGQYPNDRTVNHKGRFMLAGARGVVLASTDGTIMLYGENTTMPIMLQRQQTSFARFSLPLNRRHLAAITTLGVVLIWDLKSLAPTSYPVEPSQHVLGLTDATTTVEFRDEDSSISRVNLTTGERTVLVTRIVDDGYGLMPGSSWVRCARRDRLEAALAKASPITQDQIPMTLIHVPTGHTLELEPGERFAAVGDELVTLHDGVIEGGVGAGPRQTIATLPGANALAAAGDTVVVRLGTRELCRVVRPSDKTCITLPAPPTEVAVHPNGDTWTIIDGDLSRWPRGGSTIVPALPQLKVRTFGAARNELVAIGAQSVIALGRLPLQPISLPGSLKLLGGDADHLLASVDQRLSLIDLATGVTFELPFVATFANVPGTASLLGDTIAIANAPSATGGTLDMYRLSVPQEPGALRAWLTGATNAKLVGDSDLVEWPVD